jgi:hypothetical protein
MLEFFKKEKKINTEICEISTQELFFSTQYTIAEQVSIIDHICLSYNLVEHCVFPILQKEATKKMLGKISFC